MPDLAHLALFLVLGALLGALGGLFGIGGGLIAIPVLTLFFRLDQQHAQGTALAMVAPNVLAGLWSYAKRGDLDRRVALLLGGSAVAFTFWARSTPRASPARACATASAPSSRVLGIYFAYRALRAPQGRAAGAAGLGLERGRRRAWAGSSRASSRSAARCSRCRCSACSSATRQTAAQGLSLALVAPGTIVGIVTYALAGDVDWGIGIPLALGGTFCVRYGVALAHRLPERTLRLLFCGLLVGGRGRRSS